MSGCGYSSGDWDCREGGYMYDAGSGEGYDPEDSTYICPQCRTKDFLEAAKDDAESTSSYSGSCGSGTGVTIWARAEKEALSANPVEARKALSELGVVGALDHDESEEGYSVVFCNTQCKQGGQDE
jgi:hypothetical protein